MHVSVYKEIGSYYNHGWIARLLLGLFGMRQAVPVRVDVLYVLPLHRAAGVGLMEVYRCLYCGKYWGEWQLLSGKDKYCCGSGKVTVKSVHYARPV